MVQLQDVPVSHVKNPNCSECFKKSSLQNLARINADHKQLVPVLVSSHALSSELVDTCSVKKRQCLVLSEQLLCTLLCHKGFLLSFLSTSAWIHLVAARSF